MYIIESYETPKFLKEMAFPMQNGKVFIYDPHLAHESYFDDAGIVVEVSTELSTLVAKAVAAKPSTKPKVRTAQALGSEIGKLAAKDKTLKTDLENALTESTDSKLLELFVSMAAQGTFVASFDAVLTMMSKDYPNVSDEFVLDCVMEMPIVDRVDMDKREIILVGEQELGMEHDAVDQLSVVDQLERNTRLNASKRTGAMTKLAAKTVFESDELLTFEVAEQVADSLNSTNWDGIDIDVFNTAINDAATEYGIHDQELLKIATRDIFDQIYGETTNE